MTTVAVTGSTGFLGRSVVAALESRGARVVTVGRTNPSTSRSNRESNHHVQLDLLSDEKLNKLWANERIDVLVHLAWDVTHSVFWNAPNNEAWFAATQRLSTAFEAAGGRRIVAGGTCAEVDPTAAGSKYVQAKLATLSWLQANFPGELVWLRFFNPTGPHEHADRLVPSVTEAARTSATLHIEHPSLIRDFFHVNDAGSAVAAAALGEESGVYDVGTGDGLSIRSVYERIALQAGGAGVVTFGPETDPRALVANPSLMAESFGWRAAFSGPQAIDASARWWLTTADRVANPS